MAQTIRQYKIVDSDGDTLGRVSARSKQSALRAARKFGLSGKLKAIDVGVGYTGK